MIIGFSDVITNSSSEVYTIYTSYGCKLIKDIVNAILKVGGSDKKFDDLFTIEVNLCDDDETIKEDYSLIENMSHDEIVKFAFDHDDEICEGRTLIDYITINAKDPKNKDLALIINNISNVFERREVYC